MLGRHTAILNKVYFPNFLVSRYVHVVSSDRWDMCGFWKMPFKEEDISFPPLFSFLLAGMRKGLLELLQPLWTMQRKLFIEHGGVPK